MKSFKIALFILISLILFESLIKAASALAKAPPQFASQMKGFLNDYKQSNIDANESPLQYKTNLLTFLKSILESYQNPYPFKPFHQAIREPFDYYTWGNNFLKPLIIKEQSKLEGSNNFEDLQQRLNKGENVVILSNHQTEADPQVHLLPTTHIQLYSTLHTTPTLCIVYMYASTIAQILHINLIHNLSYII